MLAFQDVNKIFVVILLLSFKGFSQKKSFIDSLPKNQNSVSMSEVSKWSRDYGVIFFCTNDYPEKAYLKQSTLFEFNKCDTLKPISLKYVLFDEYDNNSKNPFLSNTGFKDSIINQIECYIICENKTNVYRAIKMFAPNFFLLNQNEKFNLYQISFAGICPKDLTYSISLYYDLIYEIFNPQFTIEEKLEFQEKLIFQLRNEMEVLKMKMKEFEKNIQIEKEESIIRNNQLKIFNKQKNN